MNKRPKQIYHYMIRPLIYMFSFSILILTCIFILDKMLIVHIKDNCECLQYHHYTKTTIEGDDFKIELDSICAVEKQGNKIISHHLKN